MLLLYTYFNYFNQLPFFWLQHWLLLSLTGFFIRMLKLLWMFYTKSIIQPRLSGLVTVVRKWFSFKVWCADDLFRTKSIKKYFLGVVLSLIVTIMWHYYLWWTKIVVRPSHFNLKCDKIFYYTIIFYLVESTNIKLLREGFKPI